MFHKYLLIDDKKEDQRCSRVERTLAGGLKALAEDKWECVFLDYDLGVPGETGMLVLEWLVENPVHRPVNIWLNSQWRDAVLEMQAFIKEKMPEIRVITRI